MRRVDREGRERREDFAVEALGKFAAIRLVELLPGFDDDARLGQRRYELVLPATLLRRHEVMCLAQDLLEKLAGRRVAGGFLLLHDARHADLKELVEVGADDREEADAL